MHAELAATIFLVPLSPDEIDVGKYPDILKRDKSVWFDIITMLTIVLHYHIPLKIRFNNIITT